ncbi:MAG: hypothetical protein ACLGIY_00740, partial [Betaproteobacteria bacterium]
MPHLLPRPLTLSALATALGTATLLAGCASAPRTTPPPQLGAATPATLKNCTALAQSLALPDTRIT